MATIKMQVFAIGDGRFAIGQTDKLAKYVVRVSKGGKVTGVRGRRPLLTKGRYERATATPEMRAAFKEALNA